MTNSMRQELPTNDVFYFFAEQLAPLQLFVAEAYALELF